MVASQRTMKDRRRKQRQNIAQCYAMKENCRGKRCGVLESVLESREREKGCVLIE